MDESRAVSAPNDGRGDLLDILDEEIDRLPRRYREAILLCELEGASRQDAARRLGLPEGTLSSRLARGRTLLRDRLTKRGVVLVPARFRPFSRSRLAPLYLGRSCTPRYASHWYSRAEGRLPGQSPWPPPHWRREHSRCSILRS